MKMPVSESVPDATAWAMARPCIPVWAMARPCIPAWAFPESVFPESALALRLFQPLVAPNPPFCRSPVWHSAVHPFPALQQALCPLRCSRTAEACRTVRASSALQAAAITPSSLCGLLYVLLNCSFLLLPSFFFFLSVVHSTFSLLLITVGFLLPLFFSCKLLFNCVLSHFIRACKAIGREYR